MYTIWYGGAQRVCASENIEKTTLLNTENKRDDGMIVLKYIVCYDEGRVKYDAITSGLYGATTF